MKHKGIIAEVLEHGRDDWVDFAEVLWIVLGHTNSQDRVAALPLCIEVIREMLNEDLVAVGDLLKVDDNISFSQWSVDSDAAINRIERELKGLGRNPGVGDVCWLLNTKKGDSKR